MADKKFTFLEFHLHDSDLQFGPKSIGGEFVEEMAGESGEAEGTGREIEVAEGEGSNGPSVAKALLALVVLAVLVYAVRTLLGGDEELAELEELDEEL